MRLIDADAFLERIQNDTSLCAEIKLYGLKVLKKYLDLQPTAYDVEKVVKELNELDVKAIKRYKGGTFGDYEGTDYYIKKSDAIEIVKQGGVSDDVCEWRYNDSEYYWESSCDNLHIFMADGPRENNHKYCPYCGKKIKVVK